MAPIQLFFLQVMHSCVPFLQQQRELALDMGDGSSKATASSGQNKTRDSVAQQ